MDFERKEFGEFMIDRGSPKLAYDEADFEALLKVFVDATFTEEYRAEYMPKKRAFLKEQLTQPETVVVFQGDKLVGFGGLRVVPVESNPNDVYIELKSLVVSEACRGKDLAKVISEEREKTALTKARAEGKGCILFFVTENQAVMESASKRGYAYVPAREWFKETRPNEPAGPRDAEADEMENVYGMKVFRNDSYSSKNAREVGVEQKGVTTAVDSALEW